MDGEQRRRRQQQQRWQRQRWWRRAGIQLSYGGFGSSSLIVSLVYRGIPVAGAEPATAVRRRRLAIHNLRTASTVRSFALRSSPRQADTLASATQSPESVRTYVCTYRSYYEREGDSAVSPHNIKCKECDGLTRDSTSALFPN